MKQSIQQRTKKSNTHMLREVGSLIGTAATHWSGKAEGCSWRAVPKCCEAAAADAVGASVAAESAAGAIPPVERGWRLLEARRLLLLRRSSRFTVSGSAGGANVATTTTAAAAVRSGGVSDRLVLVDGLSRALAQISLTGAQLDSRGSGTAAVTGC